MFEQKKELKKELKSYKKIGVVLKLENKTASPKEIANACFAAEEGSYMRDYICDSEGMVVELCFNRVDDQR